MIEGAESVAKADDAEYDQAYSFLSSIGYDTLTYLTGFQRMPGRLVKAFREVAAPAASAPMRLLDLGSGSGRLTQTFLASYPDMEAIALEPSRAMQAKHKGKIKRDQSCKLIQGGYDSYNDRLPDNVTAEGPFDVIASTGVFDHIDFDPLIAESLAGQLKQGGYLAFTFERKANEGEDRQVVYDMEADFVKLRPDYVKRTLEEAGLEVVHESDHIGYWFPRFAPMGMVIAQKPSV